MMPDAVEYSFFALGALLTAGFVFAIYLLRKNMRRDSASGQAQAPSTELAPRSSVSDSTTVLPSAKAEPQHLEPKRTPTKLDSLRRALSNTEESLLGRMRGLWSHSQGDSILEQVEEILYTSDLGPATVERLMGTVQGALTNKQKSNFDEVQNLLKTEFMQIFSQAQIPEPVEAQPLSHLLTNGRPTVWLVVGVNGAGKTTSIGKLASRLAEAHKKVLVAAGDTFRAAAGNQLRAWSDRAQVDIFSPEGVTDPSAVAFAAVTKAKNEAYDVVIVDTAGRLHTQTNLMEELKKMKRVMAKIDPLAPHEVLIVLDANSGQNALQQARQFHQALNLTGVILTKMDGTAKGGIAVSLANELKVPIRLIGIGEKLDDLRPFSAQEFVTSLFSV